MASISTRALALRPWPFRPPVQVGRLVGALEPWSKGRARTAGWRRGPVVSMPIARNFSSSSEAPTAAFALVDQLWASGVEYIFMNPGSEHPPLLEALVEGQRTRPGRWPRVITCPHETLAMSMADGFARATGRPQAVVVHVDVGTQHLGAGVHNASVARVPVLVLAGRTPAIDVDDESAGRRGARNAYMHWLQDPPDQAAIVRQYMRYVADVRTAHNVRQMVARGLQVAASDSKGPVYLTASTDVLFERAPPSHVDLSKWGPVRSAALPPDAVDQIADALVHAERPLVLTGYSGRRAAAVQQLVELADTVPGLRVIDTLGSDVSFPASHPAFQGHRLSTHESVADADVILVLDCDVPWIPTMNPPSRDAKVFEIGVDPLNASMVVSFFPADARWRASSDVALLQLNQALRSSEKYTALLENAEFGRRARELVEAHHQRTAQIAAKVDKSPSAKLDGHNIGHLLKTLLPNAVFVMEAVTNAHDLHDQIQPSTPGSWINCGSTGIGWSNGAAMGVRMGLPRGAAAGHKPVCQVVGDGSYMIGAPASTHWIASRYDIPLLTIVLNNGGYRAIRDATTRFYPDGDGLNSRVDDDELNVSLSPPPDYPRLAEAAAAPGFGEGGARKSLFAVRVDDFEGLEKALAEAVRALSEGRGAFIEAVMVKRRAVASK